MTSKADGIRQRLVSPNEMHQAACDTMIDGRKPESETDWVRVVNFYAANTAKEIQPVGLVFLCKIMECPLSEEYILKISEYQTARMI